MKSCELSITMEFSHTPEAYLSSVGSIPQFVPVDPDVSERARVPDRQGMFRKCLCETDCGICFQLVNHDLKPKK